MFAGRELTCAVMGNEALDIIEIKPAAGGFYDYDAKYAKGGSIHVLPAEIKPNIYQGIQQLALTAHQSLGCRGVSRTDFRYDDGPDGTGLLVALEVNTQPGMTGTSLVPEIAAHRGISFGELVRWMVEDASLKPLRAGTAGPGATRSAGRWRRLGSLFIGAFPPLHARATRRCGRARATPSIACKGACRASSACGSFWDSSPALCSSGSLPAGRSRPSSRRTVARIICWHAPSASAFPKSA